MSGESHYLAAIERLCADTRTGSAGGPDEFHVTAMLIPEPTNRHDRNAVAVKVGGETVGYLPRDDAAKYSPVLTRLAAQGFLGVVTARIWAGHREEYEGQTRSGEPRFRSVFYASVRLDLDEPHLIVPGNLPPSRAHELLPFGHSIQVYGEEKHLNALTPHVGPVGEQWVYVTLHELVEQLPRSTRTVVEVRVDGDRVGQLTPKLSGDLVPALRYLDERGLVAAARGIVKGNRAAVEVTLHVQRAHQLGDAWFEQVDRRH